MNEEIKEIARKCSDTLKKGGIVLIPSSAGLLVTSNFIEGQGLQKLRSVSEKLNEEIVLVADRDEKLNYLLQDIPSLAYDLIEQSEKPVIIVYDRPSLNISKQLTGPGNTLPVMIIKDEVVSRTCNLGLKAIAAIIINNKKKENLEAMSAILPEIDYVVNLPEGSVPRQNVPSKLELKMNGEIKIIRK